jgi:crotonobetainyl-CoA:carnitine CoA-transferase CaiB-like acyl-CoA transferase
MDMQPLRGITVVSLEQAIAAPYASRHLADLGARVIKVERPGVGDFARGYDTRVRGLSSHFVWTNRNKESLTLDVKDPRGLEILRRLLREADVFLQNLAPGATERAGLGAERLQADNPRLVVCDISGYGNDGPYRDRKAYDLLIQSEAGFLSVTGSQDEPAKAGASIADIAAGIISPIMGGIDVAPVVVGLAIGAGALFALQVNSNFFWMFQTLLGVSTQGALKAHALHALSDADTAFAIEVLMKLPAKVVRENWPYGVIR